MQFFLRIAGLIDRCLRCAHLVGMWAGPLLVFVVIFDVTTRYLGVPKPWGLNSTMVQEFEYWLHTALFSLAIGFAYTKQKHIRIDLLRERMGARAKLVLEIIGCTFFLIPFTLVGLWYQFAYAYSSYLEDEVSKSVIGLSNIWLLKFVLVLMFALLLAAGVSELIKSTIRYLQLSRGGDGPKHALET